MPFSLSVMLLICGCLGADYKSNRNSLSIYGYKNCEVLNIWKKKSFFMIFITEWKFCKFS